MTPSRAYLYRVFILFAFVFLIIVQSAAKSEIELASSSTTESQSITKQQSKHKSFWPLEPIEYFGIVLLVCIHYGIVILMMPEIMVGSFIGVQLNLIAPQAVILASLGLVLCFVSYKTSTLATKMHREEQKAKEAQKSSQPHEELLQQPEKKEIEMKQLNCDQEDMKNNLDGHDLYSSQLKLIEDKQKQILNYKINK